VNESQSLILNPRRRKLSDLGLTPDSSEMALASDSLFDKFGLFAEQVNTCHHSGVQDEAVGAIADTGLADFENLDFADLLEIKDEHGASSTLSSMDVPGFDNINDQIFNMESVLDDASLDSIKSDCMWSSVNLFPSLMDSHVNSSNTANSRKRRHRDVSLTLSECAEGLLSINQLDVVNMLEKFSDDPDPTLGASPTFLSSSFGASMMGGHENQNSNDSSNDIESETETDEDDEIDVVGTNSDLGGSSARTRHCNLAINRANKNQKHHLKQQNNDQSRSLLKKQQKPAQTNRNTSILDDHCYFLARPQKDIKPLKGMLTPNESSEDEDIFESQTSNFNTAQPTTQTQASMVDKRKIAEAVQSLINNKPNQYHGQNNAGASANPQNPNTGNIKFKFRMKFKSTQAATNMKKAVNKGLTEVMNSNAEDEVGPLTDRNSLQHRVSNTSSSDQILGNRQRRKSASKNSYCPTPNARDSRSNGSSPVKQQKKNNTTSHNSRTSTPPATANNSGVDSPDSEKCREIRDLHNSMERQRRVEQRNHLAYLKKQVPEVADMDKASKLTILRKAMDYCHLLSNMDSRIRKDQAKELSRNQMLKKKLLDLTQKHDARRVTGSGRHTGWSGSQRW
jgi:hypothetical protein